MPAFGVGQWQPSTLLFVTYVAAAISAAAAVAAAAEAAAAAAAVAQPDEPDRLLIHAFRNPFYISCFKYCHDIRYSVQQRIPQVARVQLCSQYNAYALSETAHTEPHNPSKGHTASNPPPTELQSEPPAALASPPGRAPEARSSLPQ